MHSTELETESKPCEFVQLLPSSSELFKWHAKLLKTPIQEQLIKQKDKVNICIL